MKPETGALVSGAGGKAASILPIRQLERRRLEGGARGAAVVLRSHNGVLRTARLGVEPRLRVRVDAD